MAIPDAARCSEILSLWRLVAEDLQEMHRLSALIASGSTSIEKLLDIRELEQIMAAKTMSPEEVAAEAYEQTKATARSFQQLTLKSLLIGGYTQRIAELAHLEIAANEQQLLTLHPTSPTNIN